VYDPNITNLITSFENNPNLENLVLLSNALVLENRAKEITHFILQLNDFDGTVLNAIPLGIIDNSSIEAMVLTAWQLPLGLGNTVIIKLEDTFPYSTPQKTITITTLELNDQIEIHRIGKMGSNFISLDTVVKCYRGKTLVWTIEFNINSHWGGVTDNEVIAALTPIAKAAGAQIEVKNILL